jgi:hypothetical protein
MSSRAAQKKYHTAPESFLLLFIEGSSKLILNRLPEKKIYITHFSPMLFLIFLDKAFKI